jgi:hypothetical protein
MVQNARACTHFVEAAAVNGGLSLAESRKHGFFGRFCARGKLGRPWHAHC